MHVPRHGGVTFAQIPFSSPGYCFPPSRLYKWKCKRICTPHPQPTPSLFWIESYRYLKQSNFSSKTFSPFDKNLCWPHAWGFTERVQTGWLVLPVVQHWRALKFRQKVTPNAEVDQWRPNMSGICKWVRPPHAFLVQVVNVWKWYYYVLA